MRLTNYHCNFCDKKLDDGRVLPEDCDCEEYVKARDTMIEEYKNSDQYQKPMTREEYDEQYPVVFSSESLVQDQDEVHKLKLEARKYQNGLGFCVWYPIPRDADEENIDDKDAEDSGLCFDFTDNDAKALYDMLTDFFSGEN